MSSPTSDSAHEQSDIPAQPRRSLLDFRLDLRRRLILIISGIVFLILTGQTLLTLANEITHLDINIANRATILTQAIAGSCVAVMHGDDSHRFDSIIHRVQREVDLVNLSIMDNTERIVGHNDPSQIGMERSGGQINVFGRPRGHSSLGSLLGRNTEYLASAPIVDGATVLGFVVLEFRSAEAAKRAAQRLRSVTAMGFFWLLAGAVIGSIYVRRITRPLATLTTAARAITRGEIADVDVGTADSDDEIGVLQRSFAHLVESLRAEQAENATLVSQLGEMNQQLRQRVDEVTADLRETGAYLQSILRCMEEGVITCDRDGRVVRANVGASRQLLGLAQPEAGMHVREVIPDGEPLAEAVMGAIQTGTNAQLRLERSCNQGPWSTWHPADAMVIGHMRTIRFRIQPLLDTESKPLGGVITVVDETEDRRLEARMRRHDRFVSLGSIAAGLAHELGNYMHSINGFSSLLLRGMPDEDTRKADLEAIHRDNGAAIKLLERFLQFARPGEGTFRYDSLHDLLRNSVDMCSFSLRKNQAELVVELGNQDVDVRCDGHLLQQVFINLLLNAADAMKGDCERKVMRVSCRLVDEEHVEIEFQDTGTGVDPEHLDRVFDPFFTTKESGGTGLGLSIAHQIIARHEGTITVESEVGKGTVFTIVLPVAGPQERTS